MNRIIFIGLLAVSAVSALASEGAIGDFARYSVILDRKPFGLPPSVAMQVADGVPAVPQDSFATYVRLTAMVQEDGNRIQVGFVDKKQKDKVYMLALGEKVDDYEVLEADLPTELAKIRKGQEEQWLSMKVPGAVAPPAGFVSQSPETSAPQPVSIAEVRPAPTPVPGLLAGLRRQSRYAAIRRAEIENEKRAETAKRLGVFREPPAGDADEDEEDMAPGDAAQMTVEDDSDEDDDDDASTEIVLPSQIDSADEDDDDEEAVDEDELIREAEIQSHLQNYQKELIRQGLPPLPIPLTPQTDAELVKEGVLAPLPVAKEDDDE